MEIAFSMFPRTKGKSKALILEDVPYFKQEFVISRKL